MTRAPHNPETGTVVTNIHEYEAAVDAAVRIVDEATRSDVPDLPALGADSLPPVPPRVDEHDPTKRRLAVEERLGKKIAANAAKERHDAETEPTDVYADYGGGLQTLEDSGNLPIGRIEDIKTETVWHGGHRAMKLSLNGRYEYVPIEEGDRGSQADNIEEAKQRLVLGRGTTTISVHTERRPKK